MTKILTPPPGCFAILDRDGTLIAERNYLSNPDQVELLPGVCEGLRNLMGMGIGLIVATNQSGIGRGYFSQDTLETIHKTLIQILGEEDIRLDAIYYCPHIPAQGCKCRKPKPGMIEQAEKNEGMIPSNSFVIGDNRTDIELGVLVAATTILVKTGYGTTIAKDPMIKPDFIVDGVL